MGVKGLIYRRKVLGYFFLLPIVTLLVVFTFYPIINSVIMSFTNWSGFNQQYDFIGLRNYERLFTNPLDTREYWRAMWVNVRFAVISTTIQTVLGFFLAVILINLSRGWQNFYKVALYMPVILPAAVVSVMWRVIYTPQYGMLNQFLQAVGLSSWTRAWTGDARYALGAVIAANTWRYVGFSTVLYYVWMLNIDREMIESSMIDGCSHLKRVPYFYFPLTRGATEINFVLSITGGLRAFDMFYLLTNGGPGTSTKVVGMLIRETAFVNFKFGRALAMSVLLFLVVVVAMVISRAVLAPRDER
ncbi:MAG: sugar ABC transporter permease [Clostridia bacterium]|nr:sugar ABC transporter permease [Clostridia bacterium]